MSDSDFEYKNVTPNQIVGGEHWKLSEYPCDHGCRLDVMHFLVTVIENVEKKAYMYCNPTRTFDVEVEDITHPNPSRYHGAMRRGTTPDPIQCHMPYLRPHNQ